MKYGWIDTRNCVPLIDGEYLIQSVFGNVTSMNYTLDGGWNTHYDKDGTLRNENVIADTYVARWYFAPTPPKVPALWEKEHLDRKEKK